jgi:pimeloyl-ACP methyl ester carboxylesterase
VVFLGGFRSDMEGTKALHLKAWAQAQGRAFLRLDYSGHGQSSGDFEDGCIGDWAEDAQAAIAALTEGPQVLVGSSMGGWIALLAGARNARAVAGLVGIAAAPDFTEDGMWAQFTEAERQALERYGRRNSLRNIPTSPMSSPAG